MVQGTQECAPMFAVLFVVSAYIAFFVFCFFVVAYRVSDTFGWFLKRVFQRDSGLFLASALISCFLSVEENFATWRALACP